MGDSSMSINVLGIDIARNVFQLHGADSSEKKVLKKRIGREKLGEYTAMLPLCTIIMESCGGSNYWARIFQRQGHTVKLISPQFVKPFVKTNKTDISKNWLAKRDGSYMLHRSTLNHICKITVAH